MVGVCKADLRVLGGGYISPATPGHMKYQFGLQTYLREQGIDVSIFSLSYYLAPQGVYPTQIKQALAALQHVIEKDGRNPGSILVGGDSAGANLCSALLLHLGRPHPLVSPTEGGVASPFRLRAPLKAALLISPWISFDTQKPSFQQNRTSDYLTIEALNRASHAYIGSGNKHDEYSEPINASVEHWTDVANHAVEKIFVWGGGGEILIDGIKEFANHIIKGFSKAEDFTSNPIPTDPEKAERPESADVFHDARGSVFVPQSEEIEEKETNPASEENGLIGKPIENALTPTSTSVENPAIAETLAKMEPQTEIATPIGAPASTEPAELAKKPEVSDEPKKTAVGKDRVKLVVTPREAHEEMIIDYVLKIRDKGEGAKEIEKWLTVVLKESKL
jgi:hypothetical protein